MMLLAQGSATETAEPVTVTMTQPTMNLEATELTVTPGVVDDQARELFLYSACFLLALAVHERTGWPLLIAELRHDERWSWVHAGVRTPGGLWLDLDGPRPGEAVSDWLSQYGKPVRRRMCPTPAEWNPVVGLHPSETAGWWRTQVSNSTGTDLIESFARILLDRCWSGTIR